MRRRGAWRGWRQPGYLWFAAEIAPWQGSVGNEKNIFQCDAFPATKAVSKD